MRRHLDISPDVLAAFSNVAPAAASKTPSEFLQDYTKFLNRVKACHPKDKRALHRCLKEAVKWYSDFMDLKQEAMRLGMKEKEKIINEEILFLDSLTESLQKRYEKSLWI